jgi:hypothetical protein
MWAVLKNNRLQKYYIAFFGIVPLLLLTSFIKVNCPICDGKGHVSSTPAMENVVLTNVTATEQTNIISTTCYMYVMYLYNISASVRNDNSDASSGYIEFDLKDSQNGSLLDVEYLPIQLNGKAATQTQYSIWFKTSTSTYLKTNVEAEILNSAFPCQICNGTGKIALNTWALVRALKGNLQPLNQTEQQYIPPPYNPPDIEDIEAANN